MDVWTEKLRAAEAEVKISKSAVPGRDPCCRFCGATFEIPVRDPQAERFAWARLRKHVEKLHPKEWAASL